MQYRKLGRYGIRVSEVGLGSWLTQGAALQDDQSAKIVHRAFDLGINFFDTADQYSDGAAESSLGHSVKDLKREDLVLATKCYFPMSDAPNDKGLSRKHIVESVHNSLRRLGTDYIDLMQFHRYDADTPLDETVRAIDDLVRQGKVLYWGVSEWTPEQMTEAVSVAKELNANPPVSDQPRYSLLQRGIEDGVLGACERHGLGVVVFSPLAQGVLTGKYLPGQPAPVGTRAADATSNKWMGRFLSDETLQRVQKLKAYVEGSGFTMAHFALAWCLRQKAISSVIIGATSVVQLESNVGASGLSVDPAVFQKAEAILAGE